MQQIIEWRRANVMELLSKGENSQSEIARILQVDKSIVCRDTAYLRLHGPYYYAYWKDPESKKLKKKYIGDHMPKDKELSNDYRNDNNML
jgi:predicted transcriptional regulator